MHRFLLGGLLILFFISGYSNIDLQKEYLYKQYGTKNNDLPEDYVYDIVQDEKNYLWIGTGNGLVRFDGKKFKVFTVKDGLAENFISSLFIDSKGVLWIGHQQGKITTLTDTFKIYNYDLKSQISQIFEFEKSIIIVAQQNQILKISSAAQHQLITLNHKCTIYAVHPLNDKEWLIGCDSGLKLAALSNNKLTINKLFAPILKINTIVPGHNKGFWIGAGEGLYHLNKKFELIKFNDQSDYPVTSIVIHDSMMVWSTMGDGFFKALIKKNNLENIKTLKTNSSTSYIQKIFISKDNHLWVGSYGSGLLAFDNLSFAHLPIDDKDKKNITALNYNNKAMYVGGDNHLFKTGDNSDLQPIAVLPSKITTILNTPKGALVGTSDDGLYFVDTNKSIRYIMLRNDKPSKSINHINEMFGYYWIATKNGLYQLNKTYKIVNSYTTRNKLPHNHIQFIFNDIQNEKLWVITPTNTTVTVDKDGLLNRKRLLFKNTLIDITSIYRTYDNKLVITTLGDGVFLVDDSITQFTTEQGLFSNYCYSIIEDLNKNLWVGHKNGLSKIIVKSLNIITQTFPDIEFNKLAVEKDQNGQIWWGTNDGIFTYNSSLNTSINKAPAIDLMSMEINDKVYRNPNKLNLKYSKYKLKFNYNGINIADPKNITYRYKLNGFDEGWSKPTKSTEALYRVEDGDYTFYVKACSKNGECSNPEKVMISIAKPIWKKWWFITLLSIIVISLLITIIKIRDVQHNKYKALLKSKVEEGTQVIADQRDELEKKNKDIMSSIRYAKHIQRAILPEAGELNKLLQGSFIYYQPRDIVSGDFYWFEGNTKEIIVICADCTGHGVPGAFLSMMGEILISKIIQIKSTQPDQILHYLDLELRQILRKNREKLIAKDGMDISICKINIETRAVEIASAQRPVFIYTNNKIVQVKGDKMGINGERLANNIDFKLHKMQLNKGDSIYMFTDGYVDQFGGPMDKKFKLSNFRKLLAGIQHEDIQAQSYIIKKTFLNWQGGKEQVDDVCVIGMKV